MGGPLDFARNKSKFQEIPETGITFKDVAVSGHAGSHCSVVLACQVMVTAGDDCVVARLRLL